MITQKEILSKVKEANARYIRLLTTDGKVIVALNNPKITIKQRVSQIVDALKTDMNPDGKYIVELKSSPGTDGYQWEVFKGKNIESSKVISESALPRSSETDKVRTFDAALKDTKALSDLEHEVARLREENDRLKKDVLADEEEEEGLEDDPNDLPADSSWLKSFVEVIPAIADRYFNVREREVKLQEEKTKTLSAPPVDPFKRAVDIYNSLCEKQDADGITSFMNALQGQHPHVFNQLTTLINEQSGEANSGS